MWVAIINILLGLWLMISPALLQFEKIASDNNYIVGPLVLTFAITALWELNRSALFFNIAIGAWLVISPFILAFQSPVAIWATILSGVLIAGFSLVKGKMKRNYGGGWRSLFKKDAVN
ncbi:MAG TPA: hypothetical protein VJ111_04950 [Chitinophagaceae bacterium]|nr:hypothetical protein [Chitinophagaceae bacterium]